LTSSKPAVGLQYQQPVFCIGGLNYSPEISAGNIAGQLFWRAFSGFWLPHGLSYFKNQA